MVQLARLGQISDITRSGQLLHNGSIIKTTFLVFHKKIGFNALVTIKPPSSVNAIQLFTDEGGCIVTETCQLL